MAEEGSTKTIEEKGEKGEKGDVSSKAPGKKLFVVVASVVLVVVVASAGWWYYSSGKGLEKETLRGDELKRFEEEMMAFREQGKNMFREIHAMETHLHGLQTRIGRINQEIQNGEKEANKVSSGKASFDEDLTASEEESDLTVSFKLKTETDKEKNSYAQKMEMMRSALKENVVALNRFSTQLAEKKRVFDQLYTEDEKHEFGQISQQHLPMPNNQP